MTELNSGGTWQHSNVWMGGRLTATYDTKGLHFELADPLGTKRVQANEAGQVDEDCTGLPFGNDINNPMTVPCSAPVNALQTNDDATKYYFKEKEWETESGNQSAATPIKNARAQHVRPGNLSRFASAKAQARASHQRPYARVSQGYVAIITPHPFAVHFSLPPPPTLKQVIASYGPRAWSPNTLPPPSAPHTCASVRARTRSPGSRTGTTQFLPAHPE